MDGDDIVCQFGDKILRFLYCSALPSKRDELKISTAIIQNLKKKTVIISEIYNS